MLQWNFLHGCIYMHSFLFKDLNACMCFTRMEKHASAKLLIPFCLSNSISMLLNALYKNHELQFYFPS